MYVQVGFRSSARSRKGAPYQLLDRGCSRSSTCSGTASWCVCLCVCVCVFIRVFVCVCVCYTHTLTHTNRQSNCGTNLRPSRTQLSPLHALLRLQRLFFCLCFSCWGLIIPSLPVFLSFFITPRPALFSFFNPQRRKKNSRACFSSTPSGRNSEKSAPSPTSIPNWADVSEFLPSHAAPPINVLGHLPFRISAPSAAVHETFETRNPEP